MNFDLESLNPNFNTVDAFYKSISWLNKLICGQKKTIPLATVANQENFLAVAQHCIVIFYVLVWTPRT